MKVIYTYLPLMRLELMTFRLEGERTSNCATAVCTGYGDRTHADFSKGT